MPPGEPRLEADTLLANCRIELQHIGKVIATMQVCSAYDVTLVSGKILKRSGCQFIKLPDAMASLIPRYIITVDREHRNRGEKRTA